MAWEGRIRPARYFAPNDDSITFDYENVRYGFDRRSTGFDFATVDGTHVQDNGIAGRKFPFRAHFSGDNYDLEANKFMTMLALPGVGMFEHPVYGDIRCLPVGNVTRRDDLVTRANQAIVELTFWETVDILFPLPATNVQGAALAASAALDAALAEEMEDGLDVTKPSALEKFKARFKDAQAKTNAALAKIAEAEKAINDTFTAVDQAVNGAIDTFVSGPLTLAFQASILVKTPARMVGLVAARLKAYRSLAQSLIDQIHSSDGSANPLNSFLNDKLFAYSAVSGAAVSAVTTTFATRNDAINAAVLLDELSASIVAWTDDNLDALGSIDTGAAYAETLEVIAQTIKYLIEQSFQLRHQQEFTLDRPRNIIELAYEYYGNTDDDTINTLINTNALTGSEIIEVPKGRKMLRYV